MSSTKSNILNISFDTYNALINKVLSERGLEQKWLAEEIMEEGQKIESLQSQISRWLKKGEPISEQYRERINNSLNIGVKQLSNGKWIVTRTYDPLEQKINHLESQISDEGVDYEAQIHLLEYLEGRAESLSKELVEISEMMRRLRKSMDDDRHS